MVKVIFINTAGTDCFSVGKIVFIAVGVLRVAVSAGKKIASLTFAASVAVVFCAVINHTDVVFKGERKLAF